MVKKRLLLLSCRCKKGEDVSWIEAPRGSKLARRGENCTCYLEDSKGDSYTHYAKVVAYVEENKRRK